MSNIRAVCCTKKIFFRSSAWNQTVSQRIPQHCELNMANSCRSPLPAVTITKLNLGKSPKSSLLLWLAIKDLKAVVQSLIIIKLVLLLRFTFHYFWFIYFYFSLCLNWISYCSPICWRGSLTAKQESCLQALHSNCRHTHGWPSWVPVQGQSPPESKINLGLSQASLVGCIHTATTGVQI